MNVFQTPYPVMNIWEVYSCARQAIEQAQRWLSEGTTPDNELALCRDTLLTRLETCASILRTPNSAYFKDRYREERTAFEAKVACPPSPPRKRFARSAAD